MIFQVGKKGLEVEYLPYQKAGRGGNSGLNEPWEGQDLPTALKPPQIAILVAPPCPAKELSSPN